MARRSGGRERGVSLIELMIVVAVTLVVAAMAFPSLINATYNMRLRSSAYELSGMAQATRMQAIRANKPYSLCYGTVDGATMAWASETCGTRPAANEQTVQLGSNVSVVTTTGGTPTGVGAATLGFMPPPAGSTLATTNPMFSPRGLPCYRSSVTALCNTILSTGLGDPAVKYLLYVTDRRPIGANGWAAIGISPAGKVQVYVYGGTTWNKG
ncbi:MAG TPA: prepilin-type N-terminal cleavage/methylation domain-containing protein [Terriglobales bacterium]|nr:prepilin-type N-terminal cleavage/methylation domain-containing protein [Terriglobales bacterium]